MDTKEPTPSNRYPLLILLLLAALVILLTTFTVSLARISAQQALLGDLSASLGDLSGEQLLSEKLRQETLELYLKNTSQLRVWEVLPSYATFLTAAVAIFGTFATLWRQISESQRQRELDREQRALDRQQRETESRRRLDDRFTTIITNLGSDSLAIQASAAVSITTFLKEAYPEYHDQVYDMLIANLRIPHDEAINMILVRAFEKALRVKLARVAQSEEPFTVDLSHCSLYGADLQGLNLRSADLKSTNLQTANLTGADLWRARGIEVRLNKARLSQANLNEARLQKAQIRNAYFHSTNLISADLKEANLYAAKFEQARLQAAHLHRTNLVDAKFEQADLADTYFLGAKLNEQSLRSILRARNWRKAHFDAEVLARLEELVPSEGNEPGQTG
jgi:uncharacterized protein YjbI with pentapeptide repeats